MNVAQYGNILICISLDIMTLALFWLRKAVQGKFESKRCLLHKISHFVAFEEICFKIRVVLIELLYNSSACMFHHLNTNKDISTIDGLKSVAWSTHMILPSMFVSSLSFRVVFRILKVLVHPTILSTWIIFEAVRLSMVCHAPLSLHRVDCVLLTWWEC